MPENIPDECDSVDIVCYHRISREGCHSNWNGVGECPDRFPMKVKKETSKNIVVPLWPSYGFWGFCRDEIRRGLIFRYWFTLPAMWYHEQKFRREMVESLNDFNAIPTECKSGGIDYEYRNRRTIGDKNE